MEPVETNQVDGGKNPFISGNQIFYSCLPAFPKPGKVKTRLIQALGAAGACSLHRSLTSHILQIAKHFAMASNTDFMICFDGADAKAMRQMFGSDFEYLSQCCRGFGPAYVYRLCRFLGTGPTTSRTHRLGLPGHNCKNSLIRPFPS